MVNVKITVKNGTIIPYENCTYDDKTEILSAKNPSMSCSFKVEPLVSGMKSIISSGNFMLPKGTNFVMLEASGRYGDITVDFIADNDDAFCEDLLRL